MSETISKMTPIPTAYAHMFTSADELVSATYDYNFECALCGWKTDESFGCVPAMSKHLSEKHGIKPEKPLWIAAMTRSDIDKKIGTLESELAAAKAALLKMLDTHGMHGPCTRNNCADCCAARSKANAALKGQP